MSGPKAPPTMPLLRMMEINALGEHVKIDFKIWNTVEELLAVATGSEKGFLAAPVNIAAKLYNKGVDIKLTNVNTWGVMYLSTTDKNCNEWEDLKGKNLHIPFKSSPPDIVTQYLLKEHGLEAEKDLEIVYSTPSEIAQMVKAGEIEYAIPNAGIIINDKLLKENKELVDLFAKEYEKALQWTLENPKEAGELIEKHLGLKKELVEKAMPNLGLKYKSANDAKKDMGVYYETLLKFQADSIGGKTPDENFYYGEN